MAIFKKSGPGNWAATFLLACYSHQHLHPPARPKPDAGAITMVWATMLPSNVTHLRDRAAFQMRTEGPHAGDARTTGTHTFAPHGRDLRSDILVPAPRKAVLPSLAQFWRQPCPPPAHPACPCDDS